LTRPVFFPLSSEAEIIDRQTRIAQEFHIWDLNMPSATFFYMSEKVLAIWETKAKAHKENQIYIGG
jgi:hypothetical protein